jgi:hypothetical protein
VDPRIVAINDATGLLSADGLLGYGKVPDPLGGNDSPWTEHRVIRADLDSHGPHVKRCEESTGKHFARGDELWIVFEWFTPPNADHGLGQLTARTQNDVDSVTVLQVHDLGTPGYTGAAPYVALTISANLSFPNGYRTITIADHGTWDVAAQKFHPTMRSLWKDGVTGTFVGGKTGTADPSWPGGVVGIKESWAFHIAFDYQPGRFFTRAWKRFRAGALVNVLDDTTTPNMPDISQSGGSPTDVGNVKNGEYAYGIPVDAGVSFDWRTAKRHFAILRNQHVVLASTGLSEIEIAERLLAW